MCLIFYDIIKIKTVVLFFKLNIEVRLILTLKAFSQLSFTPGEIKRKLKIKPNLRCSNTNSLSQTLVIRHSKQKRRRARDSESARARRWTVCGNGFTVTAMICRVPALRCVIVRMLVGGNVLHLG